MNRSRDVLQCLYATIFEDSLQPILHIVMHPARHAHATGLGDLLQASRDVHAIAVNIVAVDDDIAEIYADSKDDTSVFRNVRHPSGYLGLHLDHASNRINHAGKL